MNKRIDAVRENLALAHIMVEDCIKTIVEPYGNEGLELNVQEEDCYSVLAEIVPNEFHKVVAVRVTDDKLEMRFENESEWSPLRMVDMGFLLDEVESAHDLESGN